MTETEKLARREVVIRSMFSMEVQGLRDWQVTLLILDVPLAERIMMLGALKSEIDRMIAQLS